MVYDFFFYTSHKTFPFELAQNLSCVVAQYETKLFCIQKVEMKFCMLKKKATFNIHGEKSM